MNKFFFKKYLQTKEHWYMLIVIIIIICSFFLRFYNYTNRWGLAYDQAHDALIARVALEEHKIPLTGPFSSAGPFVTGPEWYWFIMIATAFYPPAVMTPWIVLTLLFVFQVYLLIQIGNEIGGKTMGILMGIIAAVSTAEISQSINLTNQAPLTILSALAVWSCIRYLNTNKPIFLFFLSLFISLGINTHLQGVLLLPLLIVVFFKKTEIKNYLFIFLGLVIPCIPLIIFELQTNLYDTRHMLQYFLHDQYKISLDQLGRNWKMYIGIFMPASIAEIIGAYQWTGYISISVIIISLLFSAKNMKIPKIILVLAIVLAFAIIDIRYTRTPLFSSYLMFLHPWIIILLGWSLLFFIKYNKIVGIALCILFLLGSLIKDTQNIVFSKNYTAIQTNVFEKVLQRKLPGKMVSLYDYAYRTTDKSVPLSLYLDVDHKIQDNGLKIGVSTASAFFIYPTLIKGSTAYQLYRLSGFSGDTLIKKKWILVNPHEIYHATEEWWMKGKHSY